jgi:hypothetical protein
MKHLDAPKSSNVLTFIIVDLLHLIVINKEKQSLEFKYKLGQFFIA